MLLFLTDKLFPKCILSPCLSQGRERGRRRGAGDPFSHWEGNIHLWAACKDKVVHRSGRQGSPIPTGCAGRWRWCQKLHYLPNAASLSHMAKFPLGLYLIKTNQPNKQKSMNTTKQTQQATEEWAEGFISVCYLDAFKQAALAIIYRGTGQLSGSLKEHGARAGAVSPPPSCTCFFYRAGFISAEPPNLQAVGTAKLLCQDLAFVPGGLGVRTGAQHPASAIQPGAGLVPAVQTRPPMPTWKDSQPPAITKGAWQNRSLFVCLALHKQLLL